MKRPMTYIVERHNGAFYPDYECGPRNSMKRFAGVRASAARGGLDSSESVFIPRNAPSLRPAAATAVHLFSPPSFSPFARNDVFRRPFDFHHAERWSITHPPLPRGWEREKARGETAVPFVTARNGAVFADGALRHFLSHGGFARAFCTELGNTRRAHRRDVSVRFGRDAALFAPLSKTVYCCRKLHFALLAHLELNDANNSGRNWAKFIILSFALCASSRLVYYTSLP